MDIKTWKDCFNPNCLMECSGSGILDLFFFNQLSFNPNCLMECSGSFSGYVNQKEFTEFQS